MNVLLLKIIILAGPYSSFGYDMKPISFMGCFLQMFIMNTFPSHKVTPPFWSWLATLCGHLHPLRLYIHHHGTVCVINAAIFIIFRNLHSPRCLHQFWLRDSNYCASNVVENCICANISVAKLSCGDIHYKLYQFVSVWCLLGSDLILILLSYCFILSAVMHLQSGGASTKALSTCGSHLILILFFYTLLLVFIFTNKAGKKCPQRYHSSPMSCTISSHQP